MTLSRAISEFGRRPAVLAAAGLLLLATGCESLLGPRAAVQVVAKWGRFEQAFRSGLVYSNALQDARLTVSFTSPLGTTQQVEGFWDGGRAWRVRFSPDQAGRWTYRTVCSDTSNHGLNDQSGEFICSAAMVLTSLQRHGPVRVARDHRHFEYSDGTPFFWLADTAWDGARLATPQDWEIYALTRAHQKFSVVQWAVAPGPDVNHQSAFSGRSRIAINPEFFQRLDAKVTKLRQADMVGAITPLLELGTADDVAARLPDDQAILLARYIVARWGAEPVVWLLAFESGNQGRNVGRWKRIGRAVFREGAHAPVVLCPGETPWLLDQFRSESWVDAFCCQSVSDTTDEALKWAFNGPFAAEWKREPARPMIPITPFENALKPRSRQPFSSDDVRHAAYWSLLGTVPAGVSYGAQAVASWDMAYGRAGAGGKVPELPAWRRGLFLPAAMQMTHLAALMEEIPFWKLRPDPGAVAAQPGNESAHRYIAAAATPGKELSLAYVPEDHTITLFLKALPPAPRVSWQDPRTGESHRAVAVVGDTTCQFPTPGAGDWLLVIKAGKQ